MDLSDNAVKPYDECEKPALEGTFEVDGKTCSTGFTLCIKSIKTIRRSMRKAFRPFRRDDSPGCEEYGEAAHIGDYYHRWRDAPYRPVCVDAFSGITVTSTPS